MILQELGKNKMNNGYLKKELVLGIMILFLSASVLPSISGNSDMIIYEQPEKENVNSDFNDGPSVDDWKL